jgi:signal transduction histidine kinase
MLSEIIGNAIRQAPCSKVLVGAMRHGGRIQITVTDDGVPRAEAAESAALRRASELAALHGATLNSEVRVESTTTVLRLPDALPARSAPVAIVPAQQQATSCPPASVNPAG